MANFFPYVAEDVLDFNYRGKIILDQLEQFQADFVCLQEVERYEEYWLPKLADLGYSSLIFGGPRHQVGNLIAWKNQLWQLQGSRTLIYDSMTLEEHQKRGQSAAVCLFLHLPTGEEVLVGNTHTFSDPRFADVKLFQMKAYMQAVKAFGKKNNVMCGDFNSLPDSNAVRFALGQEQKHDKDDHFYTEEVEKRTHAIWDPVDLPLNSAYANYSEGAHPVWTHYVDKFQGTLDYIFHSPTLQVKNLLPLPSLEEVTAETALPNSVFPSDHLPIMAEFSFNE